MICRAIACAVFAGVVDLAPPKAGAGFLIAWRSMNWPIWSMMVMVLR